MTFRTLFIALFAVGSCGAARAAGPQKFTLSGRIEGLQASDTLRFERVGLPGWNTEPAFEIVVRKPDRFRYKGTQEHDQLYRMTYVPRTGKVKRGERRGKSLIIIDRDRIGLSGTADKICFCSLSGGIYDEPMLAELLRVEDSLGQARDNLVDRMYSFQAAGEKAKSDSCGHAYNLFYRNNPGVERFRSLRRTYQEAHPAGTLDLLVDRVAELFHTPVEEVEATYAALAPALKESYYGTVYAEQMSVRKRLAPGQPAPDFSVVATDGRRLTLADFKGSYLLIYHWGMCPGSMQIDGAVTALYGKYKDRGLQLLGVTESVETIRKMYEKLPQDRPTPLIGVPDIRPVLGRMLEHGWTEVELETDHPENRSVMDAFAIDGWPFFVLIGPDGTILARDFSPAFYEARGVLDSVMGD